MQINYKRSQLGMLVGVFLLLGVTLYMAFAGPYSLFHLKQSETTEIKTVIVIGRHGDEWPSSEAYFWGESFDSGAREQQVSNAGQLTSIGKERMFLLGKFLKLRYYEQLLQGDPRRLRVRSADSDKCLESSQLLLAGLNPPKSPEWIWSQGPDHELASRWQPKAIHTTEERFDDLLSSRSICLLDYESTSGLSRAWKNSSKYMQLLNEFRHDLQDLRLKTGLEFEEDLEMVMQIEEHLKARQALGNAPSWCTSTVAQRLAHIADKTSECKFSQSETQRLYAGRLLDQIARDIFVKIQQQTFSVALTDEEDNLEKLRTNMLGRPAARIAEPDTKTQPEQDELPLKGLTNDKSLSLYMTDEQHLTALLQALKIYSARPHYGFLLIIELHYDATNRVHFLRLFTVNSLSHNVFPEPVRVNPIACPLDSAECSPEQFETNIRHLSVDKQSWWQQLCKNSDWPSSSLDGHSDQAINDQNSEQNFATISSTPLPSAVDNQLTSPKPEMNQTKDMDSYLEKLDNSLMVGPTDARPSPGGLPAALFTIPDMTTTRESVNEDDSSTSTSIPQTTMSMVSETTTTNLEDKTKIDGQETQTEARVNLVDDSMGNNDTILPQDSTTTVKLEPDSYITSVEETSPVSQVSQVIDVSDSDNNIGSRK